ncbi:unnamed protein product [Gordionus sp. m RMFG-2023]|uniref:NADH dehydrogenase [ubiquinone] 1 alpha subcomplex assembly factor 3-like n=1 Tax=Gordionus sp. m RMFG-2023 TaxID=3053472 RepID=UPI0030E3B1C3
MFNGLKNFRQVIKLGVRYRKYDVTENIVRHEKVTVDILNRKFEDVIMIDSYSATGFKINNGLNIYGPLIMLPRTVLSWNVANIDDITIKSLALFYLLEPNLDSLIIGVGDQKNISKFDNNIIRFMKTKGINVEALATDKACSLYNLMIYERRMVAAALLPPATFKISQTDLENLYMEPMEQMDRELKRIDDAIEKGEAKFAEEYKLLGKQTMSDEKK